MGDRAIYEYIRKVKKVLYRDYMEEDSHISIKWISEYIKEHQLMERGYTEEATAHEIYEMLLEDSKLNDNKDADAPKDIIEVRNQNGIYHFQVLLKQDMKNSRAPTEIIKTLWKAIISKMGFK